MKKIAPLLSIAYGVAFSIAIQAQQDGPQYRDSTHLVRSTDYRQAFKERKAAQGAGRTVSGGSVKELCRGLREGRFRVLGERPQSA